MPGNRTGFQERDMARYSRTFYESEGTYALTSAREIVPLIMDLVGPQSVVDLGCGVGGWLSIFREHGVEHIQGLDGEWVKPEMLRIDPAYFRAADLRRPIMTDRTYDLGICLEVAEHLPITSAPTVVQSLTGMAPVILFSAAIPNQGGTDHVNEQWPSYWAQLFGAQGYVVVDCIRRRIWDSPRINYWYCQNLLIFVDGAQLDEYPKLAAERAQDVTTMLDLVHPRMFLFAETSVPRLAKRALTAVPRMVQRRSRARAGTGHLAP
jgi:hypothetical protein